MKCIIESARASARSWEVCRAPETESTPLEALKEADLWRNGRDRQLPIVLGHHLLLLIFSSHTDPKGKRRRKRGVSELAPDQLGRGLDHRAARCHGSCVHAL